MIFRKHDLSEKMPLKILDFGTGLNNLLDRVMSYAVFLIIKACNLESFKSVSFFHHLIFQKKYNNLTLKSEML